MGRQDTYQMMKQLVSDNKQGEPLDYFDELFCLTHHTLKNMDTRFLEEIKEVEADSEPINYFYLSQQAA
jgi:hypothetical protein